MKTFPEDYPRITKTIKNGFDRWICNAKSVLFPTGRNRWFSSEKEALEYRKEVLDTIENLRVNFHDSFIVDDCNRVLKAYGVNMTIQEVVNVYCKKHHNADARPAVSLKDAFKNYMQYKEKGDDGEVRDRTIKEARSVIGRFSRRYNNNCVHHITDDKIKEYMANFENQQTRRNQRRALNTFFQWCVYQKYIKENPVKLTKSPKIIFKTPSILAIDQVKLLLKKTLLTDKELLPYIALGLFCGLRPNEAILLEPMHFHFDSKYITVDEDISKVKRKRNVRMSEQFLLYMPEYKPVKVINFRKRFDKIKVECGYHAKIGKHVFEGDKWPADILRHTYASYTLAVNPSKAELANQMGNSEYIIGKHYVDPITPEVGLLYQSLTPESVLKDETAKTT